MKLNTFCCNCDYSINARKGLGWDTAFRMSFVAYFFTGIRITSKQIQQRKKKQNQWDRKIKTNHEFTQCTYKYKELFVTIGKKYNGAATPYFLTCNYQFLNPQPILARRWLGKAPHHSKAERKGSLEDPYSSLPISSILLAKWMSHWKKNTHCINNDIRLILITMSLSPLSSTSVWSYPYW